MLLNCKRSLTAHKLINIAVVGFYQKAGKISCTINSDKFNTGFTMSEGIKEAEIIAQEWLKASALTATNKDFDAHFNLISQKVRVTGMPGFESISYDDWARASKKDFEDKVVDSVSYEGLKMSAHNDKQVMFKTLESIFVNDGSKKTHGVEVLLELEEDGVWRVIQERIMTGDEIRHVGLM